MVRILGTVGFLLLISFSAQAIEYDKVVELGDTKCWFVSSPHYNQKTIFDKEGAEIAIYLPPDIPCYRGIYFADGSGWPRYRPGYVSTVWQFVSIQFAWDWQARVSADNPKYLPTLLKALAEYTEHPELLHAPYVTTPRQGAWKNIAAYFATVPEKTIAIGYGFGDERHLNTTSTMGIPVSYAYEIRNDMGKAAGYYKKSPWKDGQLKCVAGEQGIQMHWANSKPSLGIMLIDQAIKLRQPADQFPNTGPVRLNTITCPQGWLGALMPPDKNFREVAPYAEFKGDRGTATWLINEEFAVAWRGYMSPQPPVTIHSPTYPFGLGDEYLGICSPIPAGNVTISWGPTQTPRGKHQARYIKIPEATINKIKKVTIYQGNKALGEADGASGSISAEFGPGVHLLVAVAEMKDGSLQSSHPSGFLVAGDMYGTKPEISANPSTTEKAAPTSTEASTPTAKARPEPLNQETKAAWTQKLKTALEAAIQSGQRIQFEHPMMGRGTRLKKLAGTEATLATGGTEMVLPFATLHSSYLAMAQSLASNNQPEAHALAAFFAQVSGKQTSYQKHYEKSGTGRTALDELFGK